MSNSSKDHHFAEDLDVALRLADAADEVSMARFRSGDLRVETKADLSPVTIADTATETSLRELLGELRPDDGILGEEFGEEGLSERRWILDPIDGTKNYLRGVPVWSTLIGLQAGKDIVVGVVSAPALGRRWWARKGQGAWTQDVNGQVRQIHASSVSEISEASFSFSDEEYWRERGSYQGLLDLINGSWRTRAYGDFFSHVLVAEGAVDIAAEPALMPWDMAALIPIIIESGGMITDFSGKSAMAGGCAVSTNGHLHEEVLRTLRPTLRTE